MKSAEGIPLIGAVEKTREPNAGSDTEDTLNVLKYTYDEPQPTYETATTPESREIRNNSLSV